MNVPGHSFLPQSQDTAEAVQIWGGVDLICGSWTLPVRFCWADRINSCLNFGVQENYCAEHIFPWFAGLGNWSFTVQGF